MTVQQSFVEGSQDSDFPIQNLPYGIFKDNNNPQARVGVAIGNMILDLAVLEKHGLLAIEDQAHVFQQASLNRFITLGQDVWRTTRQKLTNLLHEDNATLRDNTTLLNQCLISQKQASMQIPLDVAGYTDFYSSLEHAKNIGCMFRDKENPLLPNWKHMPVAYNGRASSVVISDTPIVRPCGQIKMDPDKPPVFAASKKLDFELEMGFFIGKNSALGRPIPIYAAQQYIFGYVLVNDWSARDIQQWEYQPLGPFLSKAFATSISPWVVMPEALEPFKVRMSEQDVELLPYLQQDNRQTYDIHLEVQLRPDELDHPVTICQSNFQYLYWSTSQQLAHHTITGCNMRVGDLLASGTISGAAPTAYGSLMELTNNGKNPLKLAQNNTRGFLEDGDELTMRAWCQGAGYKVGFGVVKGKIYPAKI